MRISEKRSLYGRSTWGIVVNFLWVAVRRSRKPPRTQIRQMTKLSNRLIFFAFLEVPDRRFQKSENERNGEGWMDQDSYGRAFKKGPLLTNARGPPRISEKRSLYGRSTWRIVVYFVSRWVG